MPVGRSHGKCVGIDWHWSSLVDSVSVISVGGFWGSSIDSLIFTVIRKCGFSYKGMLNVFFGHVFALYH